MKRALLIDSLFRLFDCSVVSALEVEDETVVEDPMISLGKGSGVAGCMVVSSVTL